MNGKIRRLAGRIKEFLVQAYGEKVKAVILYGSYARAQARSDSDVDLLVVVDDVLSPFEVRNQLSDILFDIILEQGELLSVIVLPETFFKNYNSPFLLNVREEGIRL